MRPSLGPRAQAGLVLALVATSGALLGILGDRLLASQRSDEAPAMVAPVQGSRGGMIAGSRYGERLAQRLDLSDVQRARIDSIFAEEQVRARELSREFQPQFRALADQTRERVEAVLTPEQLEQMRAMRQQRMRRPGMRPPEQRP